MKAFSDFLRARLADQILNTSTAYVVPHIIKVDTEDDETTYRVFVNGVIHEYEADTDDTEIDILDGLQAVLDAGPEPIEAERFEDVDETEALRVRQDGSFTNYVLDIQTDGAGELSVQQQVYAALFTGNPLEEDVETIEVDDEDGYQRSIAPFDPMSEGTSELNEDMVFGPAETAWGTVTHVGLFDKSEGGNLMFSGEMSVERDIDEGGKIDLLAGNLKVTIN